MQIKYINVVRMPALNLYIMNSKGFCKFSDEIQLTFISLKTQYIPKL